MTTQGPLTDAEETWVDEDHPARPHGSGEYMHVGGASRAALVTFPIKPILGRTVTEAPFNLHVGPGHVGQTYTFKRATSDWSADTVNWNKQPTVGATEVTVTVSALADGSIVTADLYPLLQEVADGRTWFGVVITSDAGSEQLLYAGESGQPASDLTIELSDNPEIPEGLFPDVGAVDVAKVMQGWRAADLDGVTGQAEYRIQYSTVDDGVDPDHDTGWLPGSLPRHDMTAYSYAFTAGETTGWRVNVRDAAGNESGWSDWAHTPYDNTIGALILDSPLAGVFGDPTVRIQAHLAGGEPITTFRIRVAKGDDQTDIVYNSHVQQGDDDGLLDFELPFRDPKSGRRILPDDKPRWLELRAEGTKKRAIREGRGDYEILRVLISADDDLEVEVPSGLTITSVASGDPRFVYSWSLAEAPDAVLVVDTATGEVLARLTADDYTVVSGSYSWTCDGILQPWRTTPVGVAAIYDEARSQTSNIVNVTPQVEGLLIVSSDPDIGVIRLVNADTSGIQSVDTTSVATKLDGSDYAVTYGPSWIKGPASGAVNTMADADKLELLRKRKHLRPRVIWSSRSIRARVADLSPMPAGLEFLPGLPRHVATFTVTQVED